MMERGKRAVDESPQELPEQTAESGGRARRGHPWRAAAGCSALIAAGFVLLAPGLNRDYYYQLAVVLPSLLLAPFTLAAVGQADRAGSPKRRSARKAVAGVLTFLIFALYILHPHIGLLLPGERSFRMPMEHAQRIILNHEALLDAVVAEMMIPEPEPLVAQKQNPLTGLFDGLKREAYVAGQKAVLAHPGSPKSANLATLFSLGNLYDVERRADRVYFNGGSFDRESGGWHSTYFYYAPDDKPDEPDSASYRLVESDADRWVYEIEYTGGSAATGRITVTRIRPNWFYHAHVAYDKQGNPL